MTQDEISAIMSLAHYIENSPLPDGGSGAYLHYADPAGDLRFTGYSILGLICCHHERTTRRGTWGRSAEPRRPNYVDGPSGDSSDQFLPLGVQRHYGFADKRGSFSPNELSPRTRNLIRQYCNQPRYSLHALPISCKNNARQIAAAILRDMPPSLFLAQC